MGQGKNQWKCDTVSFVGSRGIKARGRLRFITNETDDIG